MDAVIIKLYRGVPCFCSLCGHMLEFQHGRDGVVLAHLDDPHCPYANRKFEVPQLEVAEVDG